MDALAELAADVRAACFKVAAKVPGILRIRKPENEYQRGYNAACEDCAEHIRDLERGKSEAAS